MDIDRFHTYQYTAQPNIFWGY